MRRAVDGVRLVSSAAGLLLTVLLAVAAGDGAQAVQQGLLDAVTALPAGLRDVLVGAVQVAAVLGPAAAVAVVVARRRLDAVARVVPAAVLGAAGAWLLTKGALEGSRPHLWPQVLAGRGALTEAGWPPAGYLAACAAAVVGAGPWLERRWRRILWGLMAWSTALSVVAGSVLPLEGIAALVAGAAAGSAVLLLTGGPPDRPPAHAVADALLTCGIPVVRLRELPPASQIDGEGIGYAAETSSGSWLAVRVLAHEDWDRDLFRRLARRLVLRGPADTGASPSTLAAVEHELLMLVAAGRTGARVTEPVIAYPVASGGALLATAGGAARPLSALATEAITDPVLTQVWASVAHLQEHRLAHRALRPEHVLVEPDGTTQLTAFARAQLNAPPDGLAGDIAELLATTAARVGPRRATACALAGLGPEPLATALPYLQPLALLGPARRAVIRYDRASVESERVRGARRTLRPGGRPSLLRDLATEVSAATGTAPVPLAHLARLTWQKVLGLAGAFAALHLVLPQLAGAGAAVAALRSADWWWILAALPATFISQAFSTCQQLGTVAGRLPFGPTYQVQFAGSFLNRITPNNVGGMALNLRYLQKAGIDTGAATASIGLQSLAGGVSNVVVAAAFFAWTGQHHAGLHLTLPGQQYLLPAAVVAVMAGGLLAVTPPGRRFLRERGWPFLRAAVTTLTALAADPGKLAVGVFGALGLPSIQIVALASCTNAFGAALPFVQVGAVYMTARLVSYAVPTPGGLGAIEAGLIAGLTALGMAAAPATSAVLVYRLLTYWLNVPIGALALGLVQRRDYV